MSEILLSVLLTAYDWQPIVKSLVEPIAKLADKLIPAEVSEESVITSLDENEQKLARAYVKARIAAHNAEVALVKVAGATLAELVEAARDVAVSDARKSASEVSTQVTMLTQLATLPAVPDAERTAIEAVLTKLKPVTTVPAQTALASAKADREWLRVTFPGEFGPNGTTPLGDAGKLPTLAKVRLAARK